MGLTFRENETGAEAVVTGWTCDSENARSFHLGIPPAWQGRPVTAIASHAFENHKGIKSITLPDTIRRIGSYAFYNCTGLEKLTLTDSVESYDGGAIRECTSLAVIELHIKRGSYQILKDLIGDSGAELHVHIWLSAPGFERFDTSNCLEQVKFSNFPLADPGKERSKSDISTCSGQAKVSTSESPEVDLIFPSYYDEFREDTHARDFHYHIIGAGMGYREVVTRRGIDLIDYDRKFETVTGMPGSFATAARIAYGRLVWPYKLLPRRREQYLTYLKDHSDELLKMLTGRHEVEKAAKVMELLGTSTAAPEENAFDLGDL
ncbi:MAG: leucine-rich repeat domain-containing protein [Lachnospiraceae bacterium]|nr:leucine-rich repeat domain-containing protein [Lachnospiraceae bacterium]